MTRTCLSKTDVIKNSLSNPYKPKQTLERLKFENCMALIFPLPNKWVEYILMSKSVCSLLLRFSLNLFILYRLKNKFLQLIPISRFSFLGIGTLKIRFLFIVLCRLVPFY